MGRKKAEKPKRNTVAVRFDDEELAAVEIAAGPASVSPWVRDAALAVATGCKPPRRHRHKQEEPSEVT